MLRTNWCFLVRIRGSLLHASEHKPLQQWAGLPAKCWDPDVHNLYRALKILVSQMYGPQKFSVGLGVSDVHIL